MIIIKLKQRMAVSIALGFLMCFKWLFDRHDTYQALDVGMRHCWIRTDDKEAGMGPEGGDGGPLPSNPVGIETEIVDHTGEGDEEGSECELLDYVDTECADNLLEIGKSTGTWGPFNNCNSFANKVVWECGGKTWSEAVNSFDPGANY